MRKLLRLVATLLGVIAIPAYAADGNGLKAAFFEGINLNKLVATRQEPPINFFWDFAAPIEELPADGFSLRISGWLKVPLEGQYKFILNGDDGVRFWLDGKQVIDRWNSGTVNEETSVELSSEPHATRLEYFEISGPAWVTLFWTYPGAKTFIPVPAEAFLLDEGNAKAKASMEKSIPHDRHAGRRDGLAV